MKRIKMRMVFGSHLPVLMQLIQNTTGSVLELGSGLYSTPYLHWECYRRNRRIVTFENHPVYYGYAEQYRRDFHEVHKVTDWDEIDISEPWSVALVDHDPLARRGVELGRLLHAEYVIAHDAERGRGEQMGYNKAFELFKYRFRFDKIRMESMILSNVHDLTNFTVKV